MRNTHKKSSYLYMFKHSNLRRDTNKLFRQNQTIYLCSQPFRYENKNKTSLQSHMNTKAVLHSYPGNKFEQWLSM